MPRFLVEKYGRKRRSFNSWVTPGPLSETQISTAPGRNQRSGNFDFFHRMNLCTASAALSTRLAIARFIASESAITCGKSFENDLRI